MARQCHSLTPDIICMLPTPIELYSQKKAQLTFDMSSRALLNKKGGTILKIWCLMGHLMKSHAGEGSYCGALKWSLSAEMSNLKLTVAFPNKLLSTWMANNDNFDTFDRTRRHPYPLIVNDILLFSCFQAKPELWGQMGDVSIIWGSQSVGHQEDVCEKEISK